MSILTGCGGTGGDGKHAKATSTANGKSVPAARPIHDPPASFAVGRARAMPEAAIAGRLTAGGSLRSTPPVVLYKETAYVAAADQLQAVDTATGQVTATVTPQAKPADTGGEWGNADIASVPALVTAHGTPTVITPFVVEQTGTGTQASHTVVEVTGTNANTGKVVWRVTLRPPHWADDTYSALRASAVGADNGIAVIRISTEHGESAAAYGIDLTTSHQVWTADSFMASAVADGTVAGTALEDTVGINQRPAGLDIATGKRLWRGAQSTEVGVSRAGPHLMRVSGKDYGSGDAYDRFVNPRTGQTRRTVPADLGSSDCTYDGQSILVCSGMGPSARVAYGLDATNGAVLWQLPDKQTDRIAPTITSSWHGRVYGQADNGPIALDAHTGKDLPSPGIAPLLVNESTGLALDQQGSNLLAYPTNS